LLQVIVTLTAGIGRQRRRRRSQSTGFVATIGDGAWTLTPPVARGAMCRSCFYNFIGLPSTVPEFFGSPFCNFEIV
jgi:hypothetical protein